jgi:hypothetical protein
LNRLRLPYRGPVAQGPGQSEMLADQHGDPLRSDSKDAPSVYRAVLDSLYSFYGERPRTVVISDQHQTTQGGLPRTRVTLIPARLSRTTFSRPSPTG